MEKVKRGLVLAGGGARGSYQVGAWQALRELGWYPDVVVGTSIGAINAAMVAADDYEGAKKLWLEMTTSQIFDITVDEKLPVKQRVVEVMLQFGKAAITQGGVPSGHLHDVLLSFLDEQSVRKSSVEYGLATMHMETLAPKEMYINDVPEGELADYIVASAAIFPAVRPHEIGSEKYLDGGFFNNLPINMALARNATDIVAVDLEAIGIVKKVGKLPRGTKVRYIRSHWDLGNLFLFDSEDARKNMRLGYLDAMRTFEVFDGEYFAFIKGDVCKYFKSNSQTLKTVYTLGEDVPQSDGILAKIKTMYSDRLKNRYGIDAKRLAETLEHAGRIFGLNPLYIYSVESFNSALIEAYEKVEYKEEYSLKALAQLMEKDKLIKIICAYVKDRSNHKNISYLANLFEVEFKIALYIMYII